MMGSVVLLVACAAAHPGHGNEIERSAQVDVSPAGVEITYYVGLSSTTMREQLDAWNPGRSPEPAAAGSVAEQAFRQQFADALAARLATGLVVTLDGVAVPLTVQKAEVIPRRGSVAEVTLVGSWPKASSSGPTSSTAAPGTQSLSIEDRTMADQPGGWRIAVRGERGMTVSGDGVAPIIARAERHDMGHLPDDARNAAARLAASITRPNR